MRHLIKKIITRDKKNGWLAIATNLLYETVLVGWIAFVGLYGIEALLPTFVTARLSLVKFAIILLALSGLLAWLGQRLKSNEIQTEERKNSRLFLALIFLGAGSIITLAHYRFPWWSIPILLAGYVLTLWLFNKFPKTNS
ncbi:MAG: hypothetical protein WAT81_04005 [Candidatus Moraniibacteriota bacterium]